MYLRFVFFYRVLPGVPPEANSSSFYWWEVLNWNQDQVTPFLQMVTEFFIFFFSKQENIFLWLQETRSRGLVRPMRPFDFYLFLFYFFLGGGTLCGGDLVNRFERVPFFSFFFKSNESITYSNGSIILDYFFFEIQRQFLWLFLRGRGKRHK